MKSSQEARWASKNLPLHYVLCPLYLSDLSTTSAMMRWRFYLTPCLSSDYPHATKVEQALNTGHNHGWSTQYLAFSPLMHSVFPIVIHILGISGLLLWKTLIGVDSTPIWSGSHVYQIGRCLIGHMLSGIMCATIPNLSHADSCHSNRLNRPCSTNPQPLRLTTISLFKLNKIMGNIPIFKQTMIFRMNQNNKSYKKLKK